jgi:hypothetical protein
MASDYYAGAGFSQSGSNLAINGLGNVATFYEPNGMSIDSNKNIYVADKNTQRIRKVELLQPYTISPNLPSGLLFNTETGIISGTPTQLTPSTTYTITASNYFGVNTTTINFSVANNLCSNTTTWDGNIWSNGTPNANITAIINDIYDTANDGSLECCSLIVTDIGSLTISLSDYCNVYSDITVIPNGYLLVKSGGSLIPNNINCISTGLINVERKTPSMKRYDYTYWSSPVTTTIENALLPTKWEANHTFIFNTFNFYDIETRYQNTFISNTPDGQDDNQDAWTRTSITNNMVAGKGYASMVKSIISTGVYPRTETITFIGPLNTGQINIPLSLSQNTASNIDDFNLIGNPYPAAINSNDFIDANIANISGTLYFWTHSNTLSTAFSGLAMYNFSANDYAKYTKLGGVRAVFGGKLPSNVIGSGQGFFVEAENAANVSFTPPMMSIAYSNTTPVSFFRNSNNSKRKLWLNLYNDDFFSQQLIGYTNQTNLNYNKGWDSKIMIIKVPLKFYSIENDVMYDIQARNKYKEKDIVTLGYYAALDGEYTISIDDKEGDFEDIYLYDKSMNVCHDLITPYIFTTVTGSFDTRFELRYKQVENDEDDDDKQITITNNNSIVKVLSEGGIIANIKIYDMSGRMIKEFNEDLTQVNINDLPKGLLIFKISVNGKIITKKIIL